MRWIDEIIEVVNNHPNISEVHKTVLITRIEQWPTEEEIKDARLKLGYEK